MIQLSYVSSATRPMSAAQLLALLQQCYGHNPLHDISGLLLYGNGTFLQALEGDEAAVTALYARIERDPRHRDVKCLGRARVETRQFPGWSMGFRRMADARWETADGLHRFRKDDFNAAFLAADAGARDALLSHFGPGQAPGQAGDAAAPRREADALERQVALLREALRRAEGGVEIARLVLEDIAEAHAARSFGDAQGKLCRFALGQINGI